MSYAHIPIYPPKKKDTSTFKLHYKLTGNNDSQQRVLFVMGFGADHLVWELQQDYFTQQGFQVCTFDNRGVGLSDAPPGRYTTRLMAYDIMHLLKHLGWEKCHLVGSSMGGMISQELCYMASDIVQSFTIVSSAPRLPIPSLENIILFAQSAGKPVTQEHRAQLLMKAMYPKSWLNKPYLDGNHPELKKNSDFIHKVYLERMSKMPEPNKKGISRQARACYTHHVSTKRLSEIANSGIPILIITGDQDKVVQKPWSVHLSKHLKAKLVVMQEGGHALHYQFHAQFNSYLHSHFTESCNIKHNGNASVNRQDTDETLISSKQDSDLNLKRHLHTHSTTAFTEAVLNSFMYLFIFLASFTF